MELIIAGMVGAVVATLISRAREQTIHPYTMSCVHCKNAGDKFEISSSVESVLQPMMATHIRNNHPYAS